MTTNNSATTNSMQRTTKDKLKKIKALDKEKEMKDSNVAADLVQPADVAKPTAEIPKVKDPISISSWMKDKVEIKPSAGRSSSGVGALSVVNSNNGKRVKFSDDVLEPLKFPKTIRMLMDETNKTVFVFLDDDISKLHVLKGKSKSNTIYSSDLVAQLTDLFDLDFTGRTSITFGIIEVTNIEGKTVVGIKCEPEGENVEDVELMSEDNARENL